MILAASSTKSSSSSTFLLIILVMVVLFYFVMIRPQAKRRRQATEQQRAAQPGQRVRTTAGMYATVVGVDGDDVILEVAPGVEVRYLKRAIMEVLPDDGAGETGYAPEPEGAEHGAEDAAPAGEIVPDAGVEDAPTADGDASGHDDETISAHLGDGNPNGNAAAADEHRAPDSI